MQVLLRDGVQNDDTFLSLLSSQRELLNQLNMEAAAMRSQLGSTPNAAMLNHQHRDLSNRGSRMLLEQQNHSKVRRSSLDVLFSKRLSMEFGIPVLSSHGGCDAHEEHYGYSKTMESSHMSTILNELGESYHIMKKRRRLSSIGFLSPTFFEDHLKASRHSVVDLSSHKKSESVKIFKEAIADGDDDSNSEDEFAEEVVEESGSQGDATEESSQTQTPILALHVDPEKAKDLMEAFSIAMEKSQKSQQDIHDWDRQMGLKRSHSKTMRQTTRSRKKLRATFKKDFGAVLLESN
jgi:hypothetical protein